MLARTIKNKHLLFIFIVVFLVLIFYFLLPVFFPFSFNSAGQVEEIATSTLPIKFVATHVKTPDAVRGIYMTSCVAGTPSFREKLVKILKTTEINSLVIDVKDYTGTISFAPDNTLFTKAYEASTCKVRDMRDFIAELHKDNIYVIARITSFQDPFLAKSEPKLAIKKASDKTILWRDKKGISYIDPGEKEAWIYLSDLGMESYLAGFDEINFDYIRFPSDGDMRDIYFSYSSSTLALDSKTGKSKILKGFFEYLSGVFHPAGIPISADLFGMTTTNTDDLNIGQVLEDALPNFDFIDPMVYPSHYPPTFMGFANPAEKPYEVVKFSMTKAVERAIAASSTPSKLRPWLQDFDLGATYTSDMVRKQIKATYDSGLTSWLIWDAGNTYTVGAFLPEQNKNTVAATAH